MSTKSKKDELTIERIEEIAKLANLDLSPAEKQNFPSQLKSILEYVDKINQVNTDNIKFQSQVELKNVFRQDTAKQSLTQEQALLNRKKKSKDGYYVISTVISK